MQKLSQILYEALISTSRFPRWWILALAQASALYLIGELAQPRYWLFRPDFLDWIIFPVCVMAPTTAWLWLEIAAQKSKRENQVLAKTFFRNALETAIVIFCAVAIIIVSKLIYPDWLFSALISSIVSATATLVILFVVLCAQPFGKALRLAFDTWNKKVSLAALIALVIILAHGASFALVHGVLKNFVDTAGFSVSGHSATIWILFSVSFLLTAVIAAFLNTFLVLLFLEIIGQKKDPEVEKALINQLVASSQASHYSLDKDF